MKHYAIMSKEKHSYEELSEMLKTSDPKCNIRRVRDASEAYQIAKKLDSSVCFIDIERLSVASDYFEEEDVRMDPTESIDIRLAELKQYIVRHLDEPLRLPELANMMYVTPNYLATVFKRREGETVMSFIERERMMRAKEELETRNIRISQVAVNAGYANESYFSKIFRKHFQMTPRECRQRALELRVHRMRPR